MQKTKKWGLISLLFLLLIVTLTLIKLGLFCSVQCDFARVINKNPVGTISQTNSCYFLEIGNPPRRLSVGSVPENVHNYINKPIKIKAEMRNDFGNLLCDDKEKMARQTLKSLVIDIYEVELLDTK